MLMSLPFTPEASIWLDYVFQSTKEAPGVTRSETS